mgnify:CR=1 FL=1
MIPRIPAARSAENSSRLLTVPLPSASASMNAFISRCPSPAPSSMVAAAGRVAAADFADFTGRRRTGGGDAADRPPTERVAELMGAVCVAVLTLRV